MKTLSEYQNLAKSLNLGECKTGRLIATINFMVKHGIEPDVKSLAQMSRKSIQSAKYEAIEITAHKDNRT